VQNLSEFDGARTLMRTKIATKDLIVFLFFVGISLISIRNLIFLPGVISGWDWSIPPDANQITQAFMSIKYAWYHIPNLAGVGIGAQQVFISMYFVFYFLVSLGLTPSVISKLLLFVLMLCGLLSSYRLLRFFRKGYFSSLISSTLYMFNPYTFNIICLGGISSLTNYAIFPLSFYFFLESTDGSKNWLKYSILTVFTFLLFPIHICIIWMVLTTLYSIFKLFTMPDKKKALVIRLRTLLIVPLLVALSQAYWSLSILPQIGSAGGLATATKFFDISKVSIIDFIRLWGYWAPFFENAYKNNPLILTTSFLLPILAFGSVFVLKKDKNTIFFLLISLGVMGFFTASFMPFLIQSNFLFLGVFRDFFPFFALLAISYLYLISATIEKFRQVIKVRINKNRLRVKQIFVISIILILVATYSSPFVLTGNFNGLVTTVEFPDEYRKADEWVNLQQGIFKVLWLPTGSSIVTSEYIQNKNIPWTTDFYSMLSQIPGGFSDLNYIYRRIPDYWLLDLVYNNSTEVLGKVLGLYGIKYLILREDTERAPGIEGALMTSAILKNLKQQKDLEVVNEIGKIQILMNKNNLPIVNAADSMVIVTGDLSSLIALSYCPDFGFLKNAFIFASQQRNGEIANLSNKIVITNNNLMDLIAMSIPPEYIVDPGAYASGLRAEEGWTSLHNNYWWYDTDYQSALEDCAFTKGKNATLGIPLYIQSDDTFTILVKAYQGPNNGVISVSLDDEMIKRVDMSSVGQRGYSWENLGDVRLNRDLHNLKINSDGENVIARIMFVPKNAFETYTELLRGKEITLILKLENPTMTAYSEKASQGRFLSVKNEFNTTILIPTEDDYEFYLRASNDLTMNFGALSGRSITINGTHGELNINPSFELGSGGVPDFWSTWESWGKTDFILSNVSRSGNYSVSLSSPVNSFGCWISDPIPVLEGDKYVFDGWMKTSITSFGYLGGAYLRVDWYNSSADIADPEKNRIAYSIGPRLNGTVDWRYVSFTVEAPPNAQFARLSFEKYDCAGSAWLDDIAWSPPVKNFTWYQLGTLHLQPGYWNITLAGNLEWGADLLKLNSVKKESGNDTKITFQKIDPTKYSVHVNTTKPFTLVFSESYDPGWSAYVDGYEIKEHFLVNGFANCWYINKTGEYNITLDYTPQKVYEWGFLISLGALMTCVAYLSKDTIKRTCSKFLIKKREKTRGA